MPCPDYVPLMVRHIWLTARVLLDLVASVNAFRYAARVLHKVVMVQLAIEKLEAG